MKRQVRSVFWLLQFRLNSLANIMSDKSTEVEMEVKKASKSAAKSKKKPSGRSTDPKNNAPQAGDNNRMSVDSVRYENEDEERGMLSKPGDNLGTEKIEILLPNRPTKDLHRIIILTNP